MSRTFYIKLKQDLTRLGPGLTNERVMEALRVYDGSGITAMVRDDQHREVGLKTDEYWIVRKPK